MNQKIRYIWPAIFLANLLVILLVWRNGAVGDFQTSAGGLIAVGRLLGLLAFYLILWQMLLIGRVPWIENAWGHDRLSHIHHLNGVIAIATLLLHPVLLIMGYSREAGIGVLSQFLTFLGNYRYVLLAFIAYCLFVAIVAVSLTLIRKRLRYEVWYFIHLLLYVAIILSFAHQLYNGHDLAASAFGTYWRAMFYVVIAVFVYSRVLVPLLNYWRYVFRVTHIRRETADVISIYIGSRRAGDMPQAEAGQFIIVRFLAKGFWWEAHPFSISDVPDGQHFRITPKAVGDFTKKLPSLPAGTPVFIEGPLGRFTSDRAGDRPVLLIAGGIGITPLRGLFEEFKRVGQNVKLIYAARSHQDFALSDELDRIGSVVYTIDRLAPEFIKQNVPDVASRFVYLCGPPPMMKILRQQLFELGVPKQFILYEKFQLG